MSTILIKSGRLWNGNDFSYEDVLMENGRITKICDSICDDADFTYDAKGKIVSAGLVDAHMHMRGISPNEWGTQTEVSCFPFGVTAACDGCAGYGDKILLDSFMVKNRVFIGVPIKKNKPDFSDFERKMELYGEKVVGLKVIYDVTSSEVYDINPLKEMVAFAHARNLIIMVHCTNSPVPMADILGALEKGDILTHAYHGGIHSAAEDDYLSMLEAKGRGVIIDAGLAGNVHMDFKVFEGAIEKGAVPDIISTDLTRVSAYIRGGRYGMTMCMSIAKMLGMKEEDIFRAVTQTPAKALGKAEEWGYLHVGKKADIVVLDYTHEAFSLTDRAGNCVCDEMGYRCVLTVVDGQVVFRL